MKKTLLVMVLLMMVAARAQLSTSLPSAKIGGEQSKWTVGGYAGLGGAIGSGGGSTSLYVSPRVGYKISDSFEAGVAANLTWGNSRYLSSTMLGIGPFANYYFGRSVYLSGLFQEYFIRQKDKTYGISFSGNEAALYLGGGYMQRLSPRIYMQIGGLYNVLYNREKSYFGGGFVPNVGIVYGL